MNEHRHPHLRPLPPSLADLGDLSLDLRWTWSHAADLLWQMLDPDVWAHTRNPWLILQGVATRRLEELAHDDAFLAELRRLADARHRYLACPTWFERTHADSTLRVAYFSMEYG